MGNIIWGIILIILGASGEFVLVGTDSSTLLIIFGVGLTCYGFYQVGNADESDESNESDDSKN